MTPSLQQDHFWVDLKLPQGHEGAVWELRFPWKGMKTPHRHDLFEINLITAGRGAYLVEDRRVDLLPGTLIWLRPDQAHRLLKVNQQFSMDIWLFEEAIMKRYISEEHELFTSSREVIQHLQLSPDRTQWLGKLKASIHQHSTASEINTIMSFAFLEFSRENFNHETQDRKVSSGLQKALDLLHQNDHSLEDLSRAVDCHPTWLSRQFKSQLGISLTAYRQDLKLQKFMDLKRESPKRTLLSIALDSGFGSYAQFHRVCKKRLGKEPKAIFT